MICLNELFLIVIVIVIDTTPCKTLHHNAHMFIKVSATPLASVFAQS